MSQETEKNLSKEETIQENEAAQPHKEEKDSKEPSRRKAAKQLEAAEAEIGELKGKNGELNDRLLRLMAEYDNYKKRTTREKEEISSFAKAMCVKEILGVLDNFERALACESADAGFKKGVEMTFQQFNEALIRLGVEEIRALNEPFDPQLHNAVNQTQDENFGENVVCQVFQKGYKLGDKVIRPAMVVVANP